jgi:hypothetical protein
MKAPNKDVSKPKAVETLVSIAEIVLGFRGEAKPTLGTVARIIGRASGLLRISDLDERISVENAATVAIARKLSLVS